MVEDCRLTHGMSEYIWVSCWGLAPFLSRDSSDIPVILRGEQSRRALRRIVL